MDSMEAVLETVVKLLNQRDEARSRLARLENELEHTRQELKEICEEEGVNLVQWRIARTVNQPTWDWRRLLKTQPKEDD